MKGTKGKGKFMINQLDIFVRNLKNIINDRDIKINNLAQSMGVSSPLISNILNGAQTPSMKFALKVCEVLNVTMVDLFTPDIRQFPVKQDIQDGNLMEIVNMQKDQIASLEEELEKAMEENERLSNDITRYQFAEDAGTETVVDTSRCDDGKVKLFIEHGAANARINDLMLDVVYYSLDAERSTVEITVDEVHIEY